MSSVTLGFVRFRIANLYVKQLDFLLHYNKCAARKKVKWPSLTSTWPRDLIFSAVCLYLNDAEQHLPHFKIPKFFKNDSPY
jgi:hypothetical protein